MIPFTPEAREGLARMVAVADCGEQALRDPCMTAAMAWVESLPEQIELLTIEPVAGCSRCCFRIEASNCCGLAWSLDERALPCAAPSPPECRLRSGGVLVGQP
jgi:hypothetical protein